MPHTRHRQALAVFLSLAFHAGVFGLVYQFQPGSRPPPIDVVRVDLMVAEVIAATEDVKSTQDQEPIQSEAYWDVRVDARAAVAQPMETVPVAAQSPASMAAPPAPSPEEWAFAARYTNKNSKGYRYSWGQQVRSAMGTAVEGADQGMVRFRVEIAPNGSLSKLETLWTTSAVAEQLARKAMENMPSLLPTPTGQRLVFERTISFTPFASDGPPSYSDDCRPVLPVFRNPFAWDGQSPQNVALPTHVEKPEPLALEDCLRQLPQGSVEAETARDKRAMEKWGWK